MFLYALSFVMEPYLLGIGCCLHSSLLYYMLKSNCQNTKVIICNLQRQFLTESITAFQFHWAFRLKESRDVSFNQIVKGPGFCWTPSAQLLTIFLLYCAIFISNKAYLLYCTISISYKMYILYCAIFISNRTYLLHCTISISDKMCILYCTIFISSLIKCYYSRTKKKNTKEISFNHLACNLTT